MPKSTQLVSGGAKIPTQRMIPGDPIPGPTGARFPGGPLGAGQNTFQSFLHWGGGAGYWYTPPPGWALAEGCSREQPWKTDHGSSHGQRDQGGQRNPSGKETLSVGAGCGVACTDGRGWAQLASLSLAYAGPQRLPLILPN